MKQIPNPSGMDQSIRNFADAVKENIEELRGIRGSKMNTLTNRASKVDIIASVNELISRIFGYQNNPDSTPARASCIRVNTAGTSPNNWGTVNNCIRRFVNLVESVGSDITYTDSSTDGASFKINTDGVYAMTYVDQCSTAGGMDFGMSINSNQLTTSISSITDVNRLCVSNTPLANTSSPISITVPLSSGDVIRPHCSSPIGNGSAPNRASFTITKLP